MKLKNYLLLIFTLLFLQLTYAETDEYCPTVEEIKNHHFHQWLPLYIDNEELAFDSDVNRFAAGVTAFDTARWDVLYLEFGHCFYQGTDPMNKKIIFAKQVWRPQPNPAWTWNTENRQAQCLAKNTADCGFIM